MITTTMHKILDDKITKIQSIVSDNSIPNYSDIFTDMYYTFVDYEGPCCILVSRKYLQGLSNKKYEERMTIDIRDQIEWCINNLPYFSSQADYIRRVRNIILKKSTLSLSLFTSAIDSIMTYYNRSINPSFVIKEILHQLSCICDIILFGKDVKKSICSFCITRPSIEEDSNSNEKNENQVIELEKSYNAGAQNSLLTIGNLLITESSFYETDNSQLQEPTMLSIYNLGAKEALIRVGQSLINAEKSLNISNTNTIM